MFFPFYQNLLLFAIFSGSIVNGYNITTTVNANNKTSTSTSTPSTAATTGDDSGILIIGIEFETWDIIADDQSQSSDDGSKNFQDRSNSEVNANEWSSPIGNPKIINQKVEIAAGSTNNSGIPVLNLTISTTTTLENGNQTNPNKTNPNKTNNGTQPTSSAGKQMPLSFASSVIFLISFVTSKFLMSNI